MWWRHASDVAARGFTLIELIVTVSVASILLAIAVPGFQYIITSSRLSSTANAFVNALGQARLEAIKRNAFVQFCSDDAGENTADAMALGTACGTAAGAVYALNADGTTTMVSSAIQLPPSLTGTVFPVRFRGQGAAYEIGSAVPYTGLVADLGSTGLSTNNHRCIYLSTGRAVATCTHTGDCPDVEPMPCAQ